MVRPFTACSVWFLRFRGGSLQTRQHFMVFLTWGLKTSCKRKHSKFFNRFPVSFLFIHAKTSHATGVNAVNRISSFLFSFYDGHTKLYLALSFQQVTANRHHPVSWFFLLVYRLSALHRVLFLSLAHFQTSNSFSSGFFYFLTFVCCCSVQVWRETGPRMKNQTRTGTLQETNNVVFLSQVRHLR